MYNQISSKAKIGCLTVLVIFILIIAFIATGSLNPLTVYTNGNILAKIIVSILSVLLVYSLLQMLMFGVMRKSIELRTHKPAEDIICPGCGLPLVMYISSHGAPIMCPIAKCRVWWHNGPKCYNKGMPDKVIMFPKYPCPHCRSSDSNDRDLFDDNDFDRI